MSHFTVLVIGADYEKELRPFQENNMEDCPKEFLEFNDEEDELRQQYETDGTEYIIMPDGRKLLPWDDEFKIPGTIGMGANTHKVPEHLERRRIPHMETFATFEEFVEGWHGYERRDPEKGRYGYWEN